MRILRVKGVYTPARGRAGVGGCTVCCGVITDVWPMTKRLIP